MRFLSCGGRKNAPPAGGAWHSSVPSSCDTLPPDLAPCRKAGCRGVMGPVPQPLLIRLFDCTQGLYQVFPVCQWGNGPMGRALGRSRAVVTRRGRCPHRPAKSLPLMREVAFAKQMTEGETGRTMCARPPCERRLSPPQGGDWGIPLTGNALYVAPSSVTAFGRATFPPGGRSGALSVGATALGGPRAAMWGRPYKNYGLLPPVGAAALGGPKTFPFRGRCRAQRGG